MSQASRRLDERLRRMNERAGVLDKRLRGHAEEKAIWHGKWDDPSVSG
jgi:type II secretory pathway component PulJ